MHVGGERDSAAVRIQILEGGRHIEERESATQLAPRDPRPETRDPSMKVLVLDNYDSFTYNLVQYLGELGAELDVVRNDAVSVDELVERARGGKVIVSPGPCTPAEAGVSVAGIRAVAEDRIPLLGVCLGHQALGEAFGGKVVRHEPVHGKTARVEHDGRTIFRGLESPLVAGRYHSLVVDPALPDCLEQSAHAGDVVMAIRHRTLPAEGVQFHPESILTDHGKKLLRNFLQGPS
jgi:anthranilate synthase/aminodeoxychorismate synthase-like glutamine amidotransferase